METVHGPVTGTVTVHGAPYAIAKDRSTRGREPAGELAFSDFDSDRVHNPQQFFEAANELETTFNIPYIDNQHIAYFSAGRLPMLAPGTDPSLPTLGTGAVRLARVPVARTSTRTRSTRGATCFVNWNNKPAPGWGAASDNYSYGPVHRVQLFTGFKPGMTEADVASIMNKAATQDLRAVEDWPLIKRVLEGGPAPSALAQQAAAIVTTWVAARREPLRRPSARRTRARRCSTPPGGASAKRCSGPCWAGTHQSSSPRWSRPTTPRTRAAPPTTKAGTGTSTRT